MADKKTLQIEYDQDKDILIIEGIRYSVDLFLGISTGFEIGATFQIIKREDGVVHVRRIYDVGQDTGAGYGPNGNHI